MVFIVLALSLIFALGGLAVDMIYVYAVKVRLVTAVDSTALGVARALGRGVTQTDQGAEVTRTADMLFDANFPQQFMLTGTSPQISDGPTIAGPNVVASGTIFENDPTVEAGMREVRLTGEVMVPTFFFRIFGVDELPVRASARAARRDVNVMLVLDRSGSMEAAWPDLVDAATFFVDQFDNTTDRLGVVMFGTNSRVDLALNTGFKSGSPPLAEGLIEGQDNPDKAFTNSSWGLWMGYAELLEANDPDALNVMVFFTDGNPTSYTASFNVRTSGSSPTCSISPIEAVLATPGNFESDVTNMQRFAQAYGSYPANVGPDGRDYVIVNGTGAAQKCTGGSSNWTSTSPYAEDVELLFSGCLPQSWTPSYKNPSALVFDTEDPTDGPDYIVDACNTALRSTSSSGLTRGRHVHRTAKTLAVNVASHARDKSNALGGVNIYSIGLGTIDIDETFLRRLANENDSTLNPALVGDGSQTYGMFVNSPSSAQLRQAFQTVANEIFRLIQ
jgi:hypothetical protein